MVVLWSVPQRVRLFPSPSGQHGPSSDAQVHKEGNSGRNVIHLTWQTPLHSLLHLKEDIILPIVSQIIQFKWSTPVPLRSRGAALLHFSHSSLGPAFPETQLLLSTPPGQGNSTDDGMF